MCAHWESTNDHLGAYIEVLKICAAQHKMHIVVRLDAATLNEREREPRRTYSVEILCASRDTRRCIDWVSPRRHLDIIRKVGFTKSPEWEVWWVCVRDRVCSWMDWWGLMFSSAFDPLTSLGNRRRLDLRGDDTDSIFTASILWSLIMLSCQQYLLSFISPL